MPPEPNDLDTQRAKRAHDDHYERYGRLTKFNAFDPETSLGEVLIRAAQLGRLNNGGATNEEIAKEAVRLALGLGKLNAISTRFMQFAALEALRLRDTNWHSEPKGGDANCRTRIDSTTCDEAPVSQPGPVAEPSPDLVKAAELRGYGFALQWCGNLNPRLGGGAAEADTINEYRRLIDAKMTDEMRTAMESVTPPEPAVDPLRESVVVAINKFFRDAHDRHGLNYGDLADTVVAALRSKDKSEGSR